MISPSIYEPCLRQGIPTVQTIHNYRLVCPAAYLFRDGKVCEECIDHGLTRGVRHGCYRNSRMITAAVATMLAVHRNRRTWKEKVTAYISLTEFAKRKLVSGGLPSEKVHVKPNFLEVDPGERSASGDYALFVGRLSLEKGIDALLRAWELLRVPIPLKIVGDGPARTGLEAYSQSRALREVEYLGRLEKTQTRDAMKGARFVLVPSLWYEACPLSNS